MDCLYLLGAGIINLLLIIVGTETCPGHPQVCAGFLGETESFREEAEEITRIQEGCPVEGLVSQALFQAAGNGADTWALLFLKRHKGFEGIVPLAFPISIPSC